MSNRELDDDLPPKKESSYNVSKDGHCACPHLYTNYSESFASFQLIAS